MTPGLPSSNAQTETASLTTTNATVNGTAKMEAMNLSPTPARNADVMGKTATLLETNVVTDYPANDTVIEIDTVFVVI